MKALLTGASAGIGHALAAQLSRDGLDVVAIDRDPLPEGLVASGFRVDLSDRDAVDLLLVLHWRGDA